MARPVIRNMITLLLIAVGVYVAAAAFLYTFQRSMMYIPDTRRVAPAAAGFKAEEIDLDGDENERVLAWWTPPADDRPVLIHFHGNGGSLYWRAERYRFYTDKGYGLLAVTYRGYSGSSGSPSEASAHDDAERALAFLASVGHEPGGIVLYGESLGTGVAVRLAAKHAFHAVVLESPYTSTWSVARERFPIFPVRTLMKDKFESDMFIAEVSAPLLVVHGKEDRTIPFHFGQRLFEQANDPKRLVAIDDADHNDLYRRGAGEAVLTFLGDVTAGRLETNAK